MKTQDHNECPFSDEIVSYMYGEMPDSAQAKFEHHIAECQVCTDDFAAVSFARFETYDWKRGEFDSLETPRIVIPYKEKSVSLGERLSAWVSWVTVVPAAAALVISLGIAVMMIDRGTSKQRDVSVADAPQVERPTDKQIVPQSVNGPDLVSKLTSTGNRAMPRARQIAFKKKTAVPKTQYAKRIIPGVKLANDLAVNSPTDQFKRAPRLGMNDPEDDRSLRLTDLFDETNPPPQER